MPSPSRLGAITIFVLLLHLSLALGQLQAQHFRVRAVHPSPALNSAPTPKARAYPANSPDSDGDGLIDPEELDFKSNPQLVDTDGDDLNDFDEKYYGGDPNKPDTDNDGVLDNLDAVVYDPVFKHPRTALPSYALIDLGETRYGIYLNNTGMTVTQEAGQDEQGLYEGKVYPNHYLWNQGQESVIPVGSLVAQGFGAYNHLVNVAGIGDDGRVAGNVYTDIYLSDGNHYTVTWQAFDWRPNQTAAKTLNPVVHNMLRSDSLVLAYSYGEWMSGSTSVDANGGIFGFISYLAVLTSEEFQHFESYLSGVHWENNQAAYTGQPIFYHEGVGSGTGPTSYTLKSSRAGKRISLKCSGSLEPVGNVTTDLMIEDWTLAHDVSSDIEFYNTTRPGRNHFPRWINDTVPVMAGVDEKVEDQWTSPVYVQQQPGQDWSKSGLHMDRASYDSGQMTRALPGRVSNKRVKCSAPTTATMEG
ncbi:MAG: hypothetical protein HC904_16870 [Blastochloris sp.]|nr:hypothetical protein [Blastochloris sp.]